MFDYICDPNKIYKQSFETICLETDLSSIPENLRSIAMRIVHSCGMTDVVSDLRWSSDVANQSRMAIHSGAPILVDTEMVAQGIQRQVLPSDNEIICFLSDPRVIDISQRKITTRSAAAVEYWIPKLSGAVVVIGNAPTALFRLLELLNDGGPKPAVIFGFPVGFVGAEESKQALIKYAGNIPFITLTGRRGGSAIAAAAINAVLRDIK